MSARATVSNLNSPITYTGRTRHTEGSFRHSERHFLCEEHSVSFKAGIQLCPRSLSFQWPQSSALLSLLHSYSIYNISSKIRVDCNLIWKETLQESTSRLLVWIPKSGQTPWLQRYRAATRPSPSMHRACLWASKVPGDQVHGLLDDGNKEAAETQVPTAAKESSSSRRAQSSLGAFQGTVQTEQGLSPCAHSHPRPWPPGWLCRASNEHACEHVLHPKQHCKILSAATGQERQVLYHSRQTRCVNPRFIFRLSPSLTPIDSLPDGVSGTQNEKGPRGPAAERLCWKPPGHGQSADQCSF